MKTYVGTVTDNTDQTKSGVLRVSFVKLFDNVPQPVTYTSPFFRVNAGGLVAIPQVGDQILALYNKDPSEGESSFYYYSTIVKSKPRSPGQKTSSTHETLRSSDSKAKIYGNNNKPVTQTFTNTAGAGLYIRREFTDYSISNDVTLKAESGEEVNVGSIGVQIRNADGDSIVLNGAEPNDAYAARSLMVNTRGPQEYKCNSSDINMKIVDGGDINIENNSTGIFSLGKWFGNIRLKSRFRNIELVACSPTGAVNIITPGATIQVDGTGAVKVLAAGNIDFNTPLSINMNAGKGVNIYGGAEGVNLNSTSTINNMAPTIKHNGRSMTFTAAADALVETDLPPMTGAPSVPPTITANDYADPVGAV